MCFGRKTITLSSNTLDDTSIGGGTGKHLSTSTSPHNLQIMSWMLLESLN